MARTMNIVATKPTDDPDFLKVMDYIHHVEWEMLSQADFARKWKVNPATVWRWKTKWIKSGLMDACRQITGLALYDDVIVAERKAVKEFSDKIMDEWINLALHADREDVRMTAIEKLYTLVILPAKETQVDPGNAEGDYLEYILKNEDALNPMSVAVNLADKESEEFLPESVD